MIEHMITPRPLIITLQYPSVTWGLSGIFIHRHIRALVDAGVDFRLLSPVPAFPRYLCFNDKLKKNVRILMEGQFENIRVNRIPFTHAPFPFLRHLSFFALGLKIANVIRRDFTRDSFHPNLIHVHRIYPEGLIGLVVSRVLELPLICSARGSDVHSIPNTSGCQLRIARAVVHGCNCVVAVSRKIEEQVFAIGDSKVAPEVIYNGIDYDMFNVGTGKTKLRNQLNLPVDACLVLYVGRFEPAKGAPELLTAVDMIRSQGVNVHLVVVGPNNYQIQAPNARSAGPLSHVHHIGTVSQPDVANYMRACDIFAFPSHAEGMPNALLEAMACGMPVVTTPVGGIPEIIVDGENGLIVPVNDSMSLMNAICLLINDPSRSTMLGERATSSVRTRFSWKKNAQEHIRLYHDVLNKWQAEAVRV